MTLRVGSCFSGVGGLCGGFQDEGFQIAWQIEIDDAARGVLDHLYPGVPKFRDIRDVGAKCLSPVDVLVGGFPCTDLSVAGSRGGINAPRSGLFFEMMRIADELRVPWVVFENVAGLLSSFSPCENPPDDLPEGAEWEVEESSDFETVLRAFAVRGYRGAWRVLDAQHFGPPQRRQRVFGVFTRLPAGAERAAEVLALASSLRRDTPKGRQAKADVAAPLTGDTPGSGPGCGEDAGSNHLVVRTLGGGGTNRGYRIGAEDAAANHLVAFGLGFADSGVTESLLSRNQRGDLDTETFVIQDCRVGEKAQNGLGITQGGPAYTLQANNHMGVVSVITGSTGRADDNDAQAGHIVAFPVDVADTLVSARGGGAGTPLSRVVAFGCKDSDPKFDESGVAPTLRSMEGEHANGGGQLAVSMPNPLYYTHDYSHDRVYGVDGVAPALCAELSAGSRNFLTPNGQPRLIVRRLTPLECERLMGWADGTTAVKVVNGVVKLQADAPRYRQCGNGVVRPVARYVANRLKRVIESPELFEDPKS